PPCVFCRRPRRSPLLEANTKMTKNNYAGINPMVVRIAKSAARRMIGKYGLTESDLPDLEQELVCTGLKMMARFDPGKSKENTFIARVVESKVLDLINQRQAECRDWRKCRDSLNRTVTLLDVGVIEKIETLECEQNSDPLLILDVTLILERLPPDLREICEIMKYYGGNGLLNDMPQTMFFRKLQRLRDIFLQAGLDEKFSLKTLPPPV
ncbi:MAG: sigma factor, partial [Victivallaceae bacterium]|nr:sigma factor [Victivallaceae bacterium]